MVELQLHDATNELRGINGTLDRLKRKRTLRSRLKPVGIGYLLFKHIDEELDSSNRRETILPKG
jgi:hypothetical protein